MPKVLLISTITMTTITIENTIPLLGIQISFHLQVVLQTITKKNNGFKKYIH